MTPGKVLLVARTGGRKVEACETGKCVDIVLEGRREALFKYVLASSSHKSKGKDLSKFLINSFTLA